MYRKAIALALTSLCLIALTGCGSSSTPAATTPAATSAPADKPADAAATTTPTAPATPGSKVGETITVGGVKFTVNSVNFTPTVGEKKAKDGYTYLVVNATVENTRQGAFHSNSTVQTQATDTAKFAYDKTALAGLKAGFDADVAPGAKATGEFAFTVPVTAKGIQLNYIPDLLKQTERAVINLGDAK